MKRVAIFGGTFDPVHRGHLEPAVAALQTFGFAEVVFVPAGNPPHKLAEPRTAFVHRFAMLALATEDHDRLTLSDVELDRSPSYTVDTLRLFRSRYPTAGLYFMMGSDSFAQISTWHRWEDLLDLASLVVLRRAPSWGEPLLAAVPEPLREVACMVTPGAAPRLPDSETHAVYLVDSDPHPASATLVRERARRGEPLDDLVTPEVERYIRKHRLYHGQRIERDGR